MTNGSLHVRGRLGLTGEENDSYRMQPGESSCAFDALEEPTSSMAVLQPDHLPLPANFSSFYENQMVASEPELCPMPSSWPINPGPPSYDTYHIRELDTLNQSMPELTPLFLNDSGDLQSSAYNLVSQLGALPDVSAFNNSGLPSAIIDFQPPSLHQTGRGSVGSLTNNDQNPKLIDGKVVLRLLFKYISKPTMEDIENIAKDTGYSFNFVIDSYCQYRSSGPMDRLAFTEFAIDSQSMPNSRAPETFKTGIKTDSGYGTQIQESAIDTMRPLKPVRLHGSSAREPPHSMANSGQNKPHQCHLCNWSFSRQPDLRRHIRTHAPGAFHCPYNGCGKVFSRKDKLKVHWQRVHEDNAFPVVMSSYKRDDSDSDPNSDGQPGLSNSSTGGIQQNSTSSTNSAPSNSNSFFGYGYTLSRSVPGTNPFVESQSIAKIREELAASEVIRKLGQGGFGSVYEVSYSHATDGKDREIVACKIIRLPKDRRNRVTQRTQNEINILQFLDHSHIIKLSRAYMLGDCVFINTLPVADCNLRQFLDKQSLPLSNFDKSRIWEEIGGVASALTYIHNYNNDVGYIGCHLDVKPDNILVTVNAESKSLSRFLLADFGSATISRPTSKISPKGRGVTPKYCAPEFTRGEIGPSSDIWSLGCVLAEIFTLLHDSTMQDFEAFGSKSTDFGRKWTYSGVLPILDDWLRTLANTRSHPTRLIIGGGYANLIIEMLRSDPRERPSAGDVMRRLESTNIVSTKELIVHSGVAIDLEKVWRGLPIGIGISSEGHGSISVHGHVPIEALSFDRAITRGILSCTSICFRTREFQRVHANAKANSERRQLYLIATSIGESQLRLLLAKGALNMKGVGYGQATRPKVTDWLIRRCYRCYYEVESVSIAFEAAAWNMQKPQKQPQMAINEVEEGMVESYMDKSAEADAKGYKEEFMNKKPQQLKYYIQKRIETFDRTERRWIVIIAGLGFLADSYSLFAINMVLPMAGIVYSQGTIPPNFEVGIVIATLGGSMIGQLFFGIGADILGRRRMYGWELIITIAGTIGVATASFGVNGSLSIYGGLIAWRAILGLGIGSDCPLSAVICSEFAPTKHRARMLSAVFLFQPLGQLTATLVALIVVACFKNSLPSEFTPTTCFNHQDCLRTVDIMWRVIIGFGALPPALALGFRLAILESPRYTADVLKKGVEAAAQLHPMGRNPDIRWDRLGSIASPVSARLSSGVGPALGGGAENLENERGIKAIKRYYWDLGHGWTLFGCCLCWFVVDLPFFGLGMNNPAIIGTIWSGNGSQPPDNIYSLLIGYAYQGLIVVSIGAVTGCLITLVSVNVLGERRIQMIGFFFLFLLFVVISSAFKTLMDEGRNSAVVVLYLLCQVFFNFGPNTTTYMIPAEFFPTRYRASSHGIAAASGKFGSIVAQIAVYFISQKFGGSQGETIQNWLGIMLGCFSPFMFIGLIATIFLIPKIRGPNHKPLTLEVLAGEENRPQNTLYEMWRGKRDARRNPPRDGELAAFRDHPGEPNGETTEAQIVEPDTRYEMRGAVNDPV